VASSPELAELHELIGGLRRCVTALKSRYGDAPAMRRIVNDAERILIDVDMLEIDADELESTGGALRPAGEKIAIPDTDYDAEFWRDADDEGVGGHGRP